MADVGGEQQPQENSQEQKKAAALAYDYDGDAKWTDYWSNVLIPDHLASHPDVKKHFQLKYFKRNIDSELEVEPLATSAKNFPSSTSSSSSPQQRRPTYTPPPSRDGGTRSRATPPPPSSSSNTSGTNRRIDKQTIQFLFNAWVLIMAVIALFPFIPRGLGDRAYRFALLGGALGCVQSIYSQYGGPRSWNLSGLQSWLQSVVMASDFHQLFYCVVFATAVAPIRYSVVPIACRSVEHGAPYLKRNFSNTELYRKFLAKPCSFVENNVPVIRGLSANTEVGLGFLLAFLILTPQRNLMQTLFYWQLLKLKYHAPASSTYHRDAWSKLGSRVNPLIQRFAPFLQTPIGYAQGWFLRTA